ncbi:unnamed protein product [Lota lota]
MLCNVHSLLPWHALAGPEHTAHRVTAQHSPRYLEELDHVVGYRARNGGSETVMQPDMYPEKVKEFMKLTSGDEEISALEVNLEDGTV